MGTAETDIDTLQTSDAQQTSKISALEADMNNVKPRVGQLESDVGTLNTKVDQHTQSISGLSTDVNGLKTSKQDKLIAGSGITIGSDGKTISSAGPTYRTLEGQSEVYAEFLTFLDQAEIGDTFYLYTTDTKDNALLFKTIDSYLVKLTQLSNHWIKFMLRGPVEFLREIQDGNYSRRFFRFLGAASQQTSGGTISRGGIVEMTYSKSSSGTLYMQANVLDLSSSGTISAKTFAEVHGSLSYEFGSVFVPRALVNYAPKQK